MLYYNYRFNKYLVIKLLGSLYSSIYRVSLYK
jgi:hypothetical protein